MKACKNCGVPKPLTEFWSKKDNSDGLMSDCKKCRQVIRQRYTRGSGSGYSREGGSYRVVYDPLDTFTSSSSFRRSEIMEMVNNEYLAIGTRIRNDEKEFEVRFHGNTGDLKLSEVTA